MYLSTMTELPLEKFSRFTNKCKLIFVKCANVSSNYSHFVSILTLHRDNSGIVLHKVRIPTLSNQIQILYYI